MDKVVSNQLHSKRILEKQLHEIESKQRQSECRRQKQIQDLGVDLSKIQKTTRDLDDVIQGRSHGYHEQRRGSLPPLDSRVGLQYYQEQLRTPRSRRRLSCIAAIALTSRDHADNALSRKQNITVESYKQLPPIKNGKVESRLVTSSTDFENSRGKDKQFLLSEIKCKTGKSLSRDVNCNDDLEVYPSSCVGKQDNTIITDNNSDIKPDNTNIDDNNSDINNINMNVNLVKDNRYSVQKCTLSPEDFSDTELQSIFADAKRRDRRSSEPELHSLCIRGLHEITLGDISPFQYPISVESEELRKSIQRNLPSDIVAETDEDEPEVDTNRDDKSNESIDQSLNTRLRVRLSSISESDQDVDQNEDTSICGHNLCEPDWKKKPEPSVDNYKVVESKSLPALHHRRKSDGDVLILNNKFHSGDRSHFIKSSRGNFAASASSAASKQNFISKTSSRSETWRDVKNCRYLRSHDLPEMNEPAEVTKFVFGHRNKD